MKRSVSLLVMITIIIGASNTVGAYTGVQPWFVDEIEEANSRWHIIPGSFSGYDLRVDMSRAEFCEVLYRAYFMLYMDTPQDVEENVFTDTNLNHVNVIHHLGIAVDSNATECECDSTGRLIGMIGWCIQWIRPV